MREETCTLICSLCGSPLIEYTEGHYACHCEERKQDRTVPMRIYAELQSVGCPVCMSSQLVLPRVFSISLNMNSLVICRNPECSLYSIKNVESGIYSLHFKDEMICGVGYLGNKVNIIASTYSDLANRFLEQVALRLIEEKNKNHVFHSSTQF